MEGGPKKPPQFNYKNCVVILTFKLQSPSKYSPFDAIHLFRRFFHCSEKFLNLLILMPCSAFAIFCFTSSTLAKRFPLRTFVTQGNKIKSLGRGRVNRVGGTKLLNTQHSVGRRAHESPIGKRASMLQESKKKFTEAEHSPSQQR